MASSGTTNFLKIKPSEMVGKFSDLAKTKETIRIWVRAGEAQIYRIADFEKGPNSKLILKLFSEEEEVDNIFKDKKIYLSFSFREIDYFSEGSVEIVEKDFLKLTIAEDIFRSEKRIDERLLTFPHHQVYAYFEFLKGSDSENVVSIKKAQEQSYLDYKKKQKEDLLKEIEQFVDNPQDYIGFRAIDISKSGVAFLVGSDERKHFSNDAAHDLIVLFDGQVIELKSSKLIYNIDFVGPTGGSESKFKIGLHFKPNPDLTGLISAVIRKSNSLDVLKNDFEDFIDE